VKKQDGIKILQCKSYVKVEKQNSVKEMNIFEIKMKQKYFIK